MWVGQLLVYNCIMAEGIGNNLKEVLIAFKNVLGRLIRQYPLLVFIVIGLLWTAFYFFSSTPTKMTFALSFLVSIVSVIIYANTKKYGETLLTFMLGLLTVFSANWDAYKSILFFSFYLGFHAIIFMISSISLATKVESELTMAASFFDFNNHKKTYKALQKVTKINTKFNTLGGLERAKAVKFLAFMKVPIDEMSEALMNIEQIKIVYQTDLIKSLEFFRSLYYIKKRSTFQVNVTTFLDVILSKGMPITPDEFFFIFGRTKGILIQGKLDLTTYLDELHNLVFKGYDLEQIIEELHEK